MQFIFVKVQNIIEKEKMPLISILTFSNDALQSFCKSLCPYMYRDISRRTFTFTSNMFLECEDFTQPHFFVSLQRLFNRQIFNCSLDNCSNIIYMLCKEKVTTIS